MGMADHVANVINLVYFFELLFCELIRERFQELFLYVSELALPVADS